MSDTSPVPCTTLYRMTRMHFSTTLRPIPGMPGRIGTALCGTRDVVDQERVNRRPRRQARVHELPRCARCVRTLAAMDLIKEAKAALVALVHA
jgi:hypothetical protein